MADDMVMRLRARSDPWFWEVADEIEKLREALGYFTAMKDPNTWEYSREKAASLAFQAMASGSIIAPGETDG